MTSAYKNAAGRDAIRRWCRIRLAVAEAFTTQWDIPTSLGRTRIVELHPNGPPISQAAVVVVPGTNMNSATYLPLLGRLAAANHHVLSVDVPGQPGLSTGQRPRGRYRFARYGPWLDDVLTHTGSGPVIVLGHSVGAAIALSSTSPAISGRLLISPAGLARLSVRARVLATTLAWMAVPSPARSYALMRHLSTPTKSVDSSLISWMTLVAECCHTTLAPPPLTTITTTPPTIVASGDHDVFLPETRVCRTSPGLSTTPKPVASRWPLSNTHCRRKLRSSPKAVRRGNCIPAWPPASRRRGSRCTRASAASSAVSTWRTGCELRTWTRSRSSVS